MNKHALIIGSQTLGLAGVHNDVEAIRKRLGERGFEIDLRTKEDASAEGIREGLRALIARCATDDVALIYYSGHGARVLNPGYQPDAPESPRLLQCLVPTDWSKTQFRGLLSLELSLELRRLTAKTRNVSVIIDSCHSGQMWRGRPPEGAQPNPVARALPRSFESARAEVASKLAELRSEHDVASLYPESNPHAVRLVAAEAHRSAYELEAWYEQRTVTMGVLTAALCEVLDELKGARITWRALAMLVRERVMFRYNLQRPDLEGPGQRWAFEPGNASVGVDSGVVYFDDDGEPSLRTGRLLGAELGARYAIMPPGRYELELTEATAEACITSFEGTCARVSLTPDSVEPEGGSLAFMLESPLGQRGVSLHGDPRSLRSLRAAIQASRFVTEVEAGPLVEVLTPEGDLQLYAVSGEALTHPMTSTDKMVRTLERWAKADLVRSLGGGSLEADYRLRWGRVVGDQELRAYPGDTLHLGDHLYVAFENLSEQVLYFTAFDIGIDGGVTLLTSAQPTGTRVEPGKRYVLGRKVINSGMPLSWPKSVPKPPESASLPESIVVIVATGRHDFTSLETGKRSALAPETSLGLLLGQIGSGGARNLEGQSGADTSAYTIERIDFQVCAQPRPE